MLTLTKPDGNTPELGDWRYRVEDGKHILEEYCKSDEDDNQCTTMGWVVGGSSDDILDAFFSCLDSYSGVKRLANAEGLMKAASPVEVMIIRTAAFCNETDLVRVINMRRRSLLSNPEYLTHPFIASLLRENEDVHEELRLTVPHIWREKVHDVYDSVRCGEITPNMAQAQLAALALLKPEGGAE